MDIFNQFSKTLAFHIHIQVLLRQQKLWIKFYQKKYLLKIKFLTPKYILYSFDESYSKLNAKIKKKLNYPVVIKPINEGSSVNVYICYQNNLKNRLKKLRIYREILIEKFIPGREIQAAILVTKKLEQLN